jgi:hypothetical protein
MITHNDANAGSASRRVSRIPAGHPEGYLEAFANVCAEAARAIRAAQDRMAHDPYIVFPTVEDGVRGLVFIGACVRSSAGDGSWVGIRTGPPGESIWRTLAGGFARGQAGMTGSGVLAG